MDLRDSLESSDSFRSFEPSDQITDAEQRGDHLEIEHVSDEISKLVIHTLKDASQLKKIKSDFVAVKLNDEDPVYVKITELSSALGIKKEELAKLDSSAIGKLIESHKKTIGFIKNLVEKGLIPRIKEAEENYKVSFTALRKILVGKKITRLKEFFGTELSSSSDPGRKTAIQSIQSKIFNTLVLIGYEASKSKKEIDRDAYPHISYIYSNGEIYFKDERIKIGSGAEKDVHQAYALSDETSDLVFISYKTGVKEYIVQEKETFMRLSRLGIPYLAPPLIATSEKADVQKKGIPVGKLPSNSIPGTICKKLKYLSNAALGLEGMRKKGKCIHGDVKPDNLLIVKEEGRLIDFGGVRNFGEVAKNASPAYIPPEALIEDRRKYTLNTGKPSIIRKPFGHKPKKNLFSFMNRSGPVKNEGLKYERPPYLCAPSFDCFSFGVTTFEMITGSSEILNSKGEPILFGSIKNQSEIDKYLDEAISNFELDEGAINEKLSETESLIATLSERFIILEGMAKKGELLPEHTSVKEMKEERDNINEKLRVLDQKKKLLENLKIMPNPDKLLAIRALKEVCKGLIVVKTPDPDNENYEPPENPDISSQNRTRLTCGWAARKLEEIAEGLSMLE